MVGSTIGGAAIGGLTKAGGVAMSKGGGAAADIKSKAESVS